MACALALGLTAGCATSGKQGREAAAAGGKPAAETAAEGQAAAGPAVTKELAPAIKLLGNDAGQAGASGAAKPGAGLEGLEAKSDNIHGGITEPEFYRGTGALVRRVQREPGVAVKENGQVTLNFANADIREVVDAVLGRTLGLSYIIDPKVEGQITARTSQPIPSSAVIPALENILALNGAALTLDNGIYKIETFQQAAAGLSQPVVSPSRADLARGFGIQVIPVRYASAAALGEIIRPFIGPGRILRVDPTRNLLIFAGTGADSADFVDLVKVFDVDWMAGMSFALFPVQVADAKALVADLDNVFLQNGASPIAGVVRFVPIERLNAVLAISSQQAYLDRAEAWIERLDRGSEGAGRRIFVYHVQNGRAADLADVLSRIFETRPASRQARAAELAPGLSPVTLGSAQQRGAAGQRGSVGAGAAGQTGAARQGAGAQTGAEGEAVGAAPGAGQAEVGARGQGAALYEAGGAARRNDLGAVAALQDSGNIRIIADEKNNALVVLATAAEYRMIEATLKRLDIVPLQVLIEVTIAEVRLNDDLRYGLQWFFESGNHSTTFSTLSSGEVASAFPGFSYVFTGGNARVVLNALSELTDVRVVSSPQIMVLDNQSARLQVGDEVPIATQSAVSVSDPAAPIVNSIEFKDTGVILEVTPRVNASGLITLEVLQEVSGVTATTTSALNSPTIQQRSIKSTVAVQTGDSIALGGLIQDSDEEATSGLPVLSDIPILGNLFKTTNNVKRRTELLVLITPRVVRDRREAQAVTEELRRRLTALEPLQKKITQPPPLPPR